MIPSPWTELGAAAIDLGGGLVPSASPATGPAGGTVELISDGGIALDLDVAAPPPDGVPTPPADAVDLTSDDLAADVQRTGSIRLGDLHTGGAGAVRKIVSTHGDIVVDGDLRAKVTGGAVQSLVLRAPNGTVFVTGSVDAGARGNAANGADVTIAAARVVVSGTVTTAGKRSSSQAGGDGGAIRIESLGGAVFVTAGALDSAGGDGVARGGDAGPVVLASAGDLQVDGAIVASGGMATPDAAGAVGGAGGAVRISADDELTVGGRVLVRGGAALKEPGPGPATGGAAGSLSLDTSRQVTLAGVVDGRGGLAKGGAGATGGAAATLRIGLIERPSRIAIAAPLRLRGGDGGGVGGTLALTAEDDLDVSAPVDVSGGDGRSGGGAGGTLTIRVKDSGGLRVAAEVLGRGGSATKAGADGGDGGALSVVVSSSSGPIEIESSGVIDLDGGGSIDGEAGDGGRLEMRARDGQAEIGGRLLARGGASESGPGGDGGWLNLFTDTDHDGIGGDIEVESSGVIDVSGGDGSPGGDAINDGTSGVALFPDDQHLIAVTLNAESIKGGPDDGSVENRGIVIARGGDDGGDGGDVMFHGRQPDNGEDPLPGELDLDGDGGGRDGDFAGE